MFVPSARVHNELLIYDVYINLIVSIYYTATDWLYVLHDIHCSERLEHFCNLKSYGLRSCASDGLRRSADDGYLFLN